MGFLRRAFGGGDRTTKMTGTARGHDAPPAAQRSSSDADELPMERSRILALVLLIALTVWYFGRDLVQFDDPGTQALISLFSSVTVAGTAIVGIVLTSALIAEARTTRNLRLAAEVDAQPYLWSEAGRHLGLRIENHGPASARDVAITYQLQTPAGHVLGERAHRQPVMGPGRHLTMLAGNALGEPTLPTLSDMADRGMTLMVRWSWQDDTPRSWFSAGRPSHHERSRRWPAADLRDGMYGGLVLAELDADQAANTMARALLDLAKQVEQWRQDQQRPVVLRPPRKRTPPPTSGSPAASHEDPSTT